MKIRPAQTEELDVLHSIVRNATRYMDEQGIPQWDEIYPSREILRKDIERHEMHVIEAEGRPAGFIAINEVQSPEYDSVKWKYSGRVIVIHRLTIDPVYQRNGFATRLMDFAEGKAVAENYNCIRLDAFTLNPAACAMYKNLGYRTAGKVLFRKGEFFCLEKAIK